MGAPFNRNRGGAHKPVPTENHTHGVHKYLLISFLSRIPWEGARARAKKPFGLKQITVQLEKDMKRQEAFVGFPEELKDQARLGRGSCLHVS